MATIGKNVMVYTVAVLSFGLASAIAHAEPPSIKEKSADLVSPAVANSYYGTSTTHSVSKDKTGALIPTTRPAEIVELARGLGKGRLSNSDYAQRVLEYVHNNIRVEYRYGLGKGGFGALLDQLGTPFDQAHLNRVVLLDIRCKYCDHSVARNRAFNDGNDEWL